jgi:tRNA 5-methylaminomethyl-2-thiouridine biosynthesis bifunctional protein
MYDYLIVGGGVSACATAYFLKQKGALVCVVDERGIAGGGSGAAGAFVSPKLGKDNILKSLINEAYLFSNSFYTQNFPSFFTQTGVVQIPKSKNDIELFKQCIDQGLAIKSNIYEKNSILFPEAGVVDAIGLCLALLDGIDFKKEKAKYIKAKHTILAQGAYGNLLQEPYLNIRPVWGQSIDISTTTNILKSSHKQISISQKLNNKVRLGATHHRFILEQECLKEDTLFLIKEANKIQKLDDVRLIKEYSGARAGSFDYIPMIGSIIKSAKTIEKFPSLKFGRKIEAKHYQFYENTSIINGMGGRGFVLAPFIAKKLVDFLINNKEIEKELLPDRFFNRWVKRIKDK